MRRLDFEDLKGIALTFFIGCIASAALFTAVVLALLILDYGVLRAACLFIGLFIIGTCVKNIWRCLNDVNRRH